MKMNGAGEGVTETCNGETVIFIVSITNKDINYKVNINYKDSIKHINHKDSIKILCSCSSQLV